MSDADDAECYQGVEWRRETHYSWQDGNLLDTGNYSDVEVKCGERTWKLHKAILCNRCKWFETALGGSFKEATSGIVTIENFQPDQIELLIKYIYTGELPRYHYTDEGWLESSITGIKLGDFFAMPEMCRKLLVCMEHDLRHTAWVLAQPEDLPQDHAHPEDLPQDHYSKDHMGRHSAVMQKFGNAVERVYSDELLRRVRALRDLLVAFYSKVQMTMIRGVCGDEELRVFLVDYNRAPLRPWQRIC